MDLEEGRDRKGRGEVLQEEQETGRLKSFEVRREPAGQSRDDKTGQLRRLVGFSSLPLVESIVTCYMPWFQILHSSLDPTTMTHLVLTAMLKVRSHWAE